MRRPLNYIICLMIIIIIQIQTIECGVFQYKEQPLCLFASRQSDHSILVFSTIYTPKPAQLGRSEKWGSKKTNGYPTGIASYQKTKQIFVASYGNPKKRELPAIEVFNTTIIETDPNEYKEEHHYSKDGVIMLKNDSFLVGEQLLSCYPEDILIHDDTLYVACGVPGAGILQFDIPSKKLIQTIKHPDFSAIWGLEIHKDYLYVSSHCSVNQCNETQDRVFRLPLNDVTDIKPFARIAETTDGARGGYGGLSFGPDDNLYVTSFEHQAVLIFDESGQHIGKAPVKQLNKPVAIKFYHGEGFVSDSFKGMIEEFDLLKNTVEVFAYPGPLLNPGLMYITWADCPPKSDSHPRRDEL